MHSGTIGERPWGLTLASFAEARSTGQLTLTDDDGKLYCVAFASGAIVGASSPFTSDSAARVALTTQLVAAGQVAAVARAVAAAAEAGRDEVEVVAEAAQLSPEQVQRLQWRLLLQRAARTFSVERGGYVFGEQITVATVPGLELDVGPAIFLGARMNLSQERLAADLRRMGARFVLRSEEVDGERFGFTRHELPILNALRIGTSLPDLEAKRRDLEPRVTQAVIYTLVATGLCEGLPAARTRELSPMPPMEVLSALAAVPPAAVAAVKPAPKSAPKLAPKPAPKLMPAPKLPAAPPGELDPADLLEAMVTAAEADHGEGEPSAGDWDETTLAQVRTATYDGPRAWARPEHPRTRTVSSSPPPVASAARLSVTREVIASGVALLDANADHFALLGLPRDATTDAVRAAYVALASHLHPDKLPVLDPATMRAAQRLFAQVNIAYGVLSDRARRTGYLAALASAERGQAPEPPPAHIDRARRQR